MPEALYITKSERVEEKNQDFDKKIQAIIGLSRLLHPTCTAAYVGSPGLLLYSI